jgi:hypothetical protein
LIGKLYAEDEERALEFAEDDTDDGPCTEDEEGGGSTLVEK